MPVNTPLQNEYMPLPADVSVPLIPNTVPPFSKTINWVLWAIYAHVVRNEMVTNALTPRIDAVIANQAKFATELSQIASDIAAVRAELASVTPTVDPVALAKQIASKLSDILNKGSLAN